MEGNASVHNNSVLGLGSMGGGVFVGPGASFIMQGGASVYDNSVQAINNALFASGGGVAVGSVSDPPRSTFTMRENATVSRNQAIGSNGRGGGVFVDDFGDFRLAGGTVHGTNASIELRNTAVTGAALFANTGTTATATATFGGINGDDTSFGTLPIIRDTTINQAGPP
jgi:hypothetical protein